MATEDSKTAKDKKGKGKASAVQLSPTPAAETNGQPEEGEEGQGFCRKEVAGSAGRGAERPEGQEGQEGFFNQCSACSA